MMFFNFYSYIFLQIDECKGYVSAILAQEQSANGNCANYYG